MRERRVAPQRPLKPPTDVSQEPERQRILLKLLGAARYEDIGRRAGTRAAAAKQAAELHDRELGDHAAATEESEDRARVRQETLTALAESLEVNLAMIADTTGQVTQHRNRGLLLADEHIGLARVSSPAGVVELQASVTTAEATYTSAVEAEDKADTSRTVAETAKNDGPQRHEVERTIAAHTEYSRLRSAQPTVEADATTTREEEETATQVARDTAAALEAVRAIQEEARTAATAAASAVSAIAERRRLLAAVATPDTVADLDARGRITHAAVETAQAELSAAEEVASLADQHHAMLPPADRLQATLEELDAYEQAARELGDHTATAATRAASLKGAATARDQAQRAADDAAKALDEVLSSAAAAGLRPHLQIGHACPVCDQTVATLPPPLTDGGVSAARLAATVAQTTLADVTTSLTTAAKAATSAENAVEISTRQLASHDQRLTRLAPDRAAGVDARDTTSDRVATAALLAQVRAATTQRKDAAQRLEAARSGAKFAAAERAAVETDTVGARSQLHTLRGPVVTLGAPEVDDTQLADAWAQLASWTTDQMTALDTIDVPAAKKVSDRTAAELVAAEGRLTAARDAASTTAAAHTQAAVAATDAKARERTLLEGLETLHRLLIGSPTPEQALALLEECTALEEALAAATAVARAATTARRTAETDRDEWREKAAAARIALARARDHLVPLGAPAADEVDLAEAWKSLTTWATKQAGQRIADVAKAAAAEAEAARALAKQIAALDAKISEHGVDPDRYRTQLNTSPASVAQVIAVELEKANGELRAIEKSRAKSSELRQKIKAETEAAQVAGQLAGMMRSDKFPQWLATAALDTLVAGASMSLRRLSGDQYDLTHRNGEFYVIDHIDADAQRSVRTLSGGETFQASLALALALSDQLASLTPRHTATLDSIFLDEGFGTLDPEALETVAETLENLAKGERMVGVITHVTELADRAPVRYQVAHDSRTSTVVREGA